MAIIKKIKLWLVAMWEGRADLLRCILMVGLFRPLAYVLPLEAIRALAALSAVPMALGNSFGRRTTKELTIAFGLSWPAALALCLRSYAHRFYEFAWEQKLIAGLGGLGRAPIRIEASDEIKSIIASNTSLVCAMAHFERDEAMASVFRREVFDRRIEHITAPPPPGLDPHSWRVRLQLKQALRAVSTVRPEGLNLVMVGNSFSKIVDALRNKRLMVTVNVDAHWARGRTTSLSRPFAGFARRTFSSGAAKLARLGCCPLLLALPIMDADKRTARLRLLGPYAPTAGGDENADHEVTSKLLDEIEREVGRRPAEYLLSIGGERHWDSSADSWKVPMTVQLPANLAPGTK